MDRMYSFMIYAWKKAHIKKSLYTFCLLILLSGRGLTVTAQDLFAPDRPGIGSGSYVVSPSTIYLESGVQFSSSGNLNEFSLGQLLMRYGIWPALEFDIFFNSLIFRDFNGTTDTGIQDSGIGIKYNILADRKGQPVRVSLLGTLSIPTGSRNFTADEWTPGITLLADTPIGDHWGLTGNAGYTVGTGSQADRYSLIITPGYAVPSIDKLGAYFGYAGFYSSADDRHFAEAGLTLLAHTDIQLDVNSGLELSDGDFFLGFGLVKRWK